MSRRRPDRAQTLRSRRLWWSRNGAFVQGLLSGVALCLAITWIAQIALSHGR